MANSIITDAGLNLFSRAQAEGFTVPIDKMYIADVEGLDPSAVPSAGEGIPEGAMAYELDAGGRIEANCVVYSKVLGADEGNFYINWMGIYSSRHQTLVAVCYVPRHLKYKTVGFNAGNTLYKNFAIQFANASALTGITVPAETWQVNLDDRYALLNHGHDDRYALLNHGHAVGDVNGLQTALDGKLETSHNTDENAHPGTFVKRVGDTDITGNLTLMGSGKGSLFASGSVKAGYMESSGNIKAANMETPGNVSAYTVLANRIWMDAPAATGACDVYGRDASGVNMGCFRSYTDANGVRAAVMIVYDAAGNNVGSLGISHESDGSSSSWLSVCNGRPTEIARCDWVQSQIAAKASGAPGYPNLSASGDYTSAYNADTSNYGWTAPSNGWILAYARKENAYCSYCINGLPVGLSGGSSWDAGACFVPIRAGQRFVCFKCPSPTSGAFGGMTDPRSITNLIFYPNA